MILCTYTLYQGLEICRRNFNSGFYGHLTLRYVLISAQIFKIEFSMRKFVAN